MFRHCHARLTRTPLWTLQVLALAACDVERAHSLPFTVSFACDGDRERSEQLVLRIVRGGCTGGDTVYETTLRPGQEAPASTVGPGVYGLEASAFGGGALLAHDCVETSLPEEKDEEPPAILLRSPTCDAETAHEPDADLSAPCRGDCSDSLPCTDDRCLDGECVNEPFTGARECDGIACTEGDRCELGMCQAGTPNHGACPDDGNPCTTETCEPETGCTRESADGAACDDQAACTDRDVCRSGVCRGTDICAGACGAATDMCGGCGGPADCDDRNPCTTDSCAGGACQYVNNTLPCDDGKSCTRDDVCSDGVCAGSSICPSSASCGESDCSCNNANETLCGDVCIDLASSNEHCGRCERTCVSATCQNGACRPDGAPNCTAYGFGGHDYLVCTDPLLWQHARERCYSYGFGLAIIGSQSENEFLRMRSGRDRWIGANDRGANGSNCRRSAEEGSWYWADPYDASSSGDNFELFCAYADATASSCTAANGSYVNWRDGQPNNLTCEGCSQLADCSEGEDCGLLNADGTWSDASCYRQLGFICETP